MGTQKTLFRLVKHTSNRRILNDADFLSLRQFFFVLLISGLPWRRKGKIILFSFRRWYVINFIKWPKLHMWFLSNFIVMWSLTWCTRCVCKFILVSLFNWPLLWIVRLGIFLCRYVSSVPVLCRSTISELFHALIIVFRLQQIYCGVRCINQIRAAKCDNYSWLVKL